MKNHKLFLTIILLFCIVAVKGQDINQAQRWIKIGNSLRETQQFDQAENYLLKGLKTTRDLKNKYWEAVACENLGLLYANTEEKITAGQYFNDALEIYKILKMNLSVKVINDMIGNYGIASDNVWQTYGGIEVGSKGVKFSIIKVRKENGTNKFESVKDGSKNTQVIDFTDDAIKETAKAVKAFMDTLLHNNVEEENIFIAVSSGVKQEADKGQGREEQLSIALKNAVPNYTPKIEFMSPCTEGELSIRGTVPAKYVYKSSLIDIGSGNTKGGFRERGQTNAECVSIPWGSVTFSKKFMNKSDKIAFAQKFLKDSIISVITRQIHDNGDLTNRPFSYFTGGVIWAMSNYLHPESVKGDFTIFTKADVDKFVELAENNYDELINPDLTRINDADLVKEAKKQIAASNKLTQDFMISGGLILQSIINQMESSGHKQYAFIRYGDIGWISGYIVQKLDSGYKKVSE